MYVKTQNGFADSDLSNLQSLLALVDGKVSSINEAAERSADPDAEGLFDEGEYVAGIAFTAIQQYMVSTYAQFKISKSEALRLSPNINTNLTYASVFDAGANFWKHRDEWGLRANVIKDMDSLRLQAQKTIETIEMLTPWSDYTLANLVGCLAPSGKICLKDLIPPLIKWREAVCLHAASKRRFKARLSDGFAARGDCEAIDANAPLRFACPKQEATRRK